jgi:hypothetical protein
MDIQLSVHRRQLHLSPLETALAQAAASRQQLNKRFQEHLAQHAAIAHAPNVAQYAHNHGAEI